MNPPNNLHIDNVVASQPELGPTPPDGGYGWIILISASLTQMTIPSVVMAYGVLIYHLNYQEDNHDEKDDTNSDAYLLWRHKIALMPIMMTVFSLLTSGWSRAIVKITHRPLLVSLSGVCLVTAAIMMTSVGVNYEDEGIFFYVFAGILAGFGSSLVSQQSEILLKHYFSTKLRMVESAYKISTVFGNIFIPLVIGAIMSKYDVDKGLLIYAAIVWQNCIIVLTYTRPTYVVAPLQKNYKILKEEAAEDEDEEIYSSQNPPEKKIEERVITVEINEQSTSNAGTANDDEQDEEVISTFNVENTSREVTEATSRLETRNHIRPSRFESDTFVSGYTYHQPESLYRETTITNGDNQPENIFAFETPSPDIGTARRTEKVKKHMIILLSILLDVKFYIYTYNNFTTRLSMLILCLVFPAYVSEQLPHLDILSMVGFVMIVFIGAMCFNIVLAFLPHSINKRLFLSGFNALAIIGLFLIAESTSKTSLLISGILASFSVYALYILQGNIYEELKIEHGKTITSMVSNSLSAMLILLVMLVYNYPYITCFKIASAFHMANPIPLLLIRKIN